MARLPAYGIVAEALPSVATVGGGSLPGETLASTAVSLVDAAGVDSLARRLRTGDDPLFTRVEDGRLLIDLRTILPEDDERVVRALIGARPTTRI